MTGNRGSRTSRWDSTLDTDTTLILCNPVPPLVQLLGLLRGPLRLTRGNFLVIKAMDVCNNLVETIFHREMTGIQPVHFSVRKVFQVRLTALPGEEDIVLSPENQGLGLLLAEKILPLRVERNIRAVIVKKVHLHAARIGSLHEPKIHVPVVGAD